MKWKSLLKKLKKSSKGKRRTRKQIADYFGTDGSLPLYRESINGLHSLPMLLKGMVMRERHYDKDVLPRITIMQVFRDMNRLPKVQINEFVSSRENDIMKRLIANSQDISQDDVQSYGSKDDIVEYLDVLIKYCNENNKPFNFLVLHLAHGKGFNHETRPIYQQQKRLETSEDTKIKVFSRIAPSCSNSSE